MGTMALLELNLSGMWTAVWDALGGPAQTLIQVVCFFCALILIGVYIFFKKKGGQGGGFGGGMTHGLGQKASIGTIILLLLMAVSAQTVGSLFCGIIDVLVNAFINIIKALAHLAGINF